MRIGPFEGEYVVGGWAIPEVKSGLGSETATPAPVEAIWEPDTPLQTLRWSDGEFIYEIIFSGRAEDPNTFDKNDLIAMAISLHEEH